MTARWLAACGVAFAAAGCDGVFGLDRLYVCAADDDDCDELRDAVDLCPAGPGGAADQDGDGVGDDCDPNVDDAVDRLLEFDSFALPDARWTARGTASWEIRDSALVLDDGAVERMTRANRQPSVELHVVPEFHAEGATVGAFVASKSATGNPLECRIEHHATGDDLVMLIGDVTTGNLTEVARVTNLPGSPEDGLRLFGSQLSNFLVRCYARYGKSDGVFVVWPHFESAADFDTIGFRVSQASAAYGAMAIYTRP